MKRSKSTKKTTKTSTRKGRVRLQPQDPFDLIRLLARSQSDPRKAVAELVQNSLDAGASTIEIDWFNEQGQRAIRLWDDGKGVFPELGREEALRRIAHTIGHSHKRDLTPAQRREQMVLGQYGIGLIGFWSVGEVLEIKSRVAGGKPLVLRLQEDKSLGEVFASRSRLLGEVDTFTEVTIRRIHPAAINKIRPPRLQAFLASELRGQLIEREAVVRIRDRVARGRARKDFTVKPQPFLGRPLEGLDELAVPGFESARIELYTIAPEEGRRGLVALSCGGTTVLDDLSEIDGMDRRRAPWDSGRIEGVIDFPELHVAPGSRRGFSHDEPVAAFLAALEGLEREITQRLEEEAKRRSQEKREHLARDIRKAFRTVAQKLPEYEFFGIRPPTEKIPVNGERAPSSRSEAPSRRLRPDGDALQPLSATNLEEEVDADPTAGTVTSRPDEEDMLFPPGPFARLAVTPKVLRVRPLASRNLRARALDADGRPCSRAVEITWSLFGPGEIETNDATARHIAPDREALLGHERGRILVVAVQGRTTVEREVPIRFDTSFQAESAVEGIPEPVAVRAPGERWRSRLRDGRWEYNDAHPDYLAVAGVEARRLRYMIHLFSKEVVLRNFGRPGDGEILERLVQILTCLDAKG